MMLPDPHVFDLVVNIGKLDPDCTAHLIVESLASRFDVQSHSESPPLDFSMMPIL